ncbi:MAG: M23 family metallopeptidase, partial [Lentimicrobium sp.]|nr:M23 family metallopeptidase [Lentimicrobium sp.]
MKRLSLKIATNQSGSMFHFRYLIFILFFFLTTTIGAQNQYPKDYFIPPVDFQLSLSGTFAELRANHFHSGIDIRTNGEENKPIFACAEGYVSRIKISAFGFGKALYIDHPNGYTTVYAHVNGFNPLIDNWVKSEQYRLEQFEADLFPPKGLLTVKQGELICYSGNSGSSEGPHLHFEIRNTKTEMPVDPQLFGFQIKDFIRPVISGIRIYPEGEGATVNGKTNASDFETAGWGPVYRLKKPDTLLIGGDFSIGMMSYDLLNGSKNKNGVSSYTVYIDSVPAFDWLAETFSFSETRYINSFIDYEHYYKSGQRYMRTKVATNNKLGMYRLPGNRGVFNTTPDSMHSVKIVVKDANKNESILRFVIKGVRKIETNKKASSDNPTISCLKEKNNFSDKGITITIPGKSIYEDLTFSYKASKALTTTCSAVHHVHTPEVPLHNYIDLSVAVDSAFMKYGNKLLLAKIRQGKSPSAIGGKYEDGKITARVREFGSYAVMAD